jgi:TRAP-type C4-dicarboxylate transport system permease small subunit
MNTLRAGFERLLEAIVIVLMAVLALEVVVGIIFRTIGMSLPWYDEIASVLLAWLTYYGAALAALKRAHIGFPGLVASLRPTLRLPVTLFAEICIFAFFILLAWVGWQVLDVLATDFLVSLPSVSVKYTQSIIPIGAVLFVIAEALNLPALLRDAKRSAAPAQGHAAAAEVTQ